jgi:transcriptional regulator with XRE-family HTH domain
MRDSLTLGRMSKVVADNVRRLRKSRDWTQAELAARVGISLGALGQIERGEVDPALSTAQAIADVFGVPIGELTGEARQTVKFTEEALELAAFYDGLKPAERAWVWELFQKLALGFSRKPGEE